PGPHAGGPSLAECGIRPEGAAPQRGNALHSLRRGPGNRDLPGVRGMKILLLHRNLPPDSYTGVAIQVHRLANALTDLGHEVSVYTHSARPADARYAVISIDLPGLRAALRLAPFLKRLWYPLWYRSQPMTGFDAVNVHGDGGFLRYRGNFVRTFHGTAALEYRYAQGIKG